MYSFGDWLKHERQKRGLTQKQLSEKTSNIKQSQISAYERMRIETPSFEVITDLLKALNMTIKSVPLDHFRTKGSDNMCRFSMYDIPKTDSVRTFNGKTYDVKGFLCVENESGEIKRITDLYYDIKTVVKDEKIEAKRKNKDDELKKLKKRKKINSI